jgi:hypothetical protein
MLHPDRVIIKSLKKQFLFVKTHSEDGVVLFEVRCQAESANLHFPCDCRVNTIDRRQMYSIIQITMKCIKSES